ncbi:hypothetical protein J4E83_005310 [Alternaria metachromatica]|uniref:uncharacterized protein n=1 Tax=Alternaria metachromatica TaxID=283354 RepID=UPI0020C2665A|nr:uncharacterized protein J4E83_005310 [Alternaria metachromatica]KAI4620947.1 hypothetical protein J4E83_005310 [Alternaria metachromatica]
MNTSFVLSPSRVFSYENGPVPGLPTPRHIRVRIVATGLCGSDVHYWRHGHIGNYVVENPITLGHESAGIVDACGSAVTGLSAFGAAKVVVIDAVAPRLSFATDFGADDVYMMEAGFPETNAQKVLEKAGLATGFDVVIDATGAEPCINCGVAALKRGGVFIQAGLGSPKIAFPIGQICDKEATLKGSFRYGPGDYKLAIQLLESNRVQLDSLITHEFAFSDAEQAFQNVADRVGIKSLIYGPGIDRAFAEGRTEQHRGVSDLPRL